MSEEREPLTDEELEEQDGEELPNREEMTVINPTGDPILGPPDLADPNV